MWWFPTLLTEYLSNSYWSLSGWRIGAMPIAWDQASIFYRRFTKYRNRAGALKLETNTTGYEQCKRVTGLALIKWIVFPRLVRGRWLQRAAYAICGSDSCFWGWPFPTILVGVAGNPCLYDMKLYVISSWLQMAKELDLRRRIWSSKCLLHVSSCYNAKPLGWLFMGRPEYYGEIFSSSYE